jgi:hypothetical protein
MAKLSVNDEGVTTFAIPSQKDRAMIRTKLITACAAALLGGGSVFAQVNPLSQQQAPIQQRAMPQQQQQPAQQLAVQQMQGRIFTYPVPQGWRLVNETTNEIFIAAPDSSMAIGFVGLERFRVGTSVQFIQQAAQLYGSQNLQILSASRLPVANCDAVEANISYTSNGQPVKAWVRVLVVQQNGFGNAYMLIAAAKPEKFDGVVGALKPLCDRIQITNALAAFGRDQLIAARPGSSSSVSLNHPMDDTVMKGWEERNKTMDNIAARRSDVMLDSYRSSDPSTGTVYTHTQDAYDPTRGGVVNPQDPTQLLTPEQQWQGWQGN